MPHLFLHMRHGKDFVQDLEGGYYTYLEDARRDAMWAAQELMRVQIRDGSFTHSNFEITDRTGSVLLVCPFHEALVTVGEG